MLLKLMVADDHTDHTPHNLGDGRYEPVVWQIYDHFDRVEYGGPLYCGGPGQWEQGEERVVKHVDSVEREVEPDKLNGNDLHSEAIRQIAEYIPADDSGWHQIVDCLSRRPWLIDQNGQMAAWWVKCYRMGDDCPVVFVHDAKAFLCDDKGQTLERLGPLSG